MIISYVLLQEEQKLNIIERCFIGLLANLKLYEEGEGKEGKPLPYLIKDTVFSVKGCRYVDVPKMILQSVIDNLKGSTLLSATQGCSLKALV